MTRMSLVLLCAALGFTLCACDRSTDPANAADTPANQSTAPAVQPVRVAAITSGPAVPPILTFGVAANRDEAQLSFKTGGVIEQLTAREGEPIRQGQVLAQLETDEIDAKVRQASEAHKKSDRDLKRGQELFKDQVITREQLDDLTTAEAIHRATLKSARYNQSTAQIIAPADGFILRRLAEDRELVAPGQPVLVVSNAQQGLVLRVGVPDRDVVNLRLDDRAEVQFDALPGQAFLGKIVEIGKSSDPRTGTYRIDIGIDNPQSAPLISGMVGRARLFSQQSDEATLDYVPIEALIDGNQKQARIFVLGDQQTAKELWVQIAFISGDFVALKDDLPPDTRIITQGAAYLQSGESVDVLR